MTDKKLLPAEEQPCNQSPHFTAVEPNPQDSLALEAIRKGLGMSGIEHDDWEFIGNKVCDSLKAAGALKSDFPLAAAEAAIKSVDPEARLHVHAHIHPAYPKGRSTSVAQRIVGALAERLGGRLTYNLPSAIMHEVDFGDYPVSFAVLHEKEVSQ